MPACRPTPPSRSWKTVRPASLAFRAARRWGMRLAVTSAVMGLCLLAWSSSPVLAMVDENHWECQTDIWIDSYGYHHDDTICERIINGFWCYAFVWYAEGELLDSGYNCLPMSIAVPMPPVDQVAPFVQLTNYTGTGTLELTRPDSAT